MVDPATRRLRGHRRAFTIRAVHAALKHGLIDGLPELHELPIDATVADIITTVGRHWPLDWIDGGTFGRFLARRIDPGIDPAAGLAELYVADLYLACAICRGVEAALSAFDRTVSGELPAAIRTVESRPEVIDEVLQLLREKLLVPVEGGALRLESYSGHGPLGAWLRVSALRIALSLRRRAQPEQAPAPLEEILDLAPNAEVKVLAQQLGADLRSALRAAIAAQPARMRAILRLYYGDGHGVEEIGRVYSVHASTVSRWLAKARLEILAQTRDELANRLGTPHSQLDSLLGHAASLEVSLESLLRSAP